MIQTMANGMFTHLQHPTKEAKPWEARLEEGSPAEKLLQSSRQRADAAWVVAELEEKERHRQAGMCLGGRVIRFVDGLVLGVQGTGRISLDIQF